MVFHTIFLMEQNLGAELILKMGHQKKELRKIWFYRAFL